MGSRDIALSITENSGPRHIDPPQYVAIALVAQE
jgi:hypothetical protein